MQRMLDLVGQIARSAALYLLAPPNGSCVRSYRSVLKDCHITSGHGMRARAIKPGAYISAGYPRKLRRYSYCVTVTFAVAVN